MKRYLKPSLIFSFLLSASFASSFGQTVQQTKGGSTIEYLVNPALPATGKVAHAAFNIRSIFHDRSGNYWFGADGGGVYRFDGKALTLFTDKDGVCHNQVRDIEEDGLGNMWFTTGKGICRYDGRAFQTCSKVTKNRVALQEWHKEPGDLWFPAGEKLGVYRYHGDSVFNCKFPGAEQEARTSSLSYDEYDVYCIFRDRAGNIWFGTQSKGVCRFDGKNFTWLREKGLAGAAVRVIFEDRSGNLWFGNNGYGLFRYDGKSLTNVTEEKKLGNPEFLKKFKEKEGTLARVWSIAQDRQGDLWIGTIDAGVWRYDGKKMTNYTTKDGLTDRGVTAICADRKGELWFGTAGELCKFDGKSFSKVVFK